MKNPLILSLLLCPLVAPSVTAQDTWHLDRIDQQALPLDCSYDPTLTPYAHPTTVYIVDSGINTSHPEFGGRASHGMSVFPNGGGDANGHGTWLASLVGGNTYGVNKRTNLVSVQVCSPLGSSTTSSVVTGLDWIWNQLTPGERAVVLIGVSGSGDSAAIRSAVSHLSNKGAVVVVPAGEALAGVNACSFSPANAPEAITVGATNRCDERAAFSNYGACVNIFAPGADVEGVGSNGTMTRSRTSAAAALVAGAATLYMEQGVTDVYSHMMTTATKGVVKHLYYGTSPNLLLHVPGTAPLTPCTPEPCMPNAASINAVFSLSGTGAGTPWSWKIEFPDSPSHNSGVRLHAGVQGTAADVAIAFAKEINDFFREEGFMAPNTNLLEEYVKYCSFGPPLADDFKAFEYQAIVTDCLDNPFVGTVFMDVQTPKVFKLFVSTPSNPSNPTCEVTSTTSCMFNPQMWVQPMSGEDCNENGQDDTLDIATGISVDSNGDLMPDECQCSSGPITRYGAGTAGTGGIVPELSITGCVMNGGELALQIDRALGGSSAVIMVGNGQETLNIADCTMYILPLLPIPPTGVGLKGSGPGNGSLNIPTVLKKLNPGVVLTFQAFVVDPGASAGIAATNAVQIIGNLGSLIG